MVKFEIFRTGLLQFIEGGYVYIGMDHFAKPGDELSLSQQRRTLHRNFQGYTTKAGADLYGMGITAISGIQSAYAQNHRDIPSWQKADRKSTRLNSSHGYISYAVFCLKKKKLHVFTVVAQFY